MLDALGGLRQLLIGRAQIRLLLLYVILEDVGLADEDFDVGVFLRDLNGQHESDDAENCYSTSKAKQNYNCITYLRHLHVQHCTKTGATF